MFIESSKDILYLVLAFCVLWLTVFLSWILYYVIAMMRSANETVKEFREKLRLVEEVAHFVREKFDRGSMALIAVAEILKRTAGVFFREKEGKKEKK